jgi:hypothetical protein
MSINFEGNLRNEISENATLSLTKSVVSEYLEPTAPRAKTNTPRQISGAQQWERSWR